MKHTASRSKSRYPFIDVIRASAVILMIIFHFAFDLKIFGYASIDFNKDPFWWGLPRFIVFLFLFSMGVSFELAYESHVDWKKFKKRLFKIGLGAILISLFTYFAYRSRWIYFGTLHCIFLCSLFALAFRGRPRLSLLLALIILVPLAFGFRWPWIKMSHASLDYIPALPWMGVVLLGMASKHGGLHLLGQNLAFFQSSWFRPFTLLSQQSLLIYLLHQPLLFGLVKLYWTLTH